MPPIRAFVVAFLSRLFAAMLIAWQMTNDFRAQDEFGIVGLALAAFAALATLAFWGACWKGGNELMPGIAAIVLAAIALAFSGFTPWMDTVDARTPDPYPSGHRDAQIVLEFLLPALLADLVIWRMTVRNLRKATGADARMRWPWLTMLLSVAVVINPLGFEVLSGAFLSGEQLSRSISQPIAGVAITTLVALLLLEWWLRTRALKR